MISRERILELFKETCVLQEGHFKLSSGRHAEKYLQCARILQYPDYAEELAESIAEIWSSEKIDLVVGPALGGVVLSFAVGQALGTRSIFTERKAGEMSLRRGFGIANGNRVLIVEDVVTTGGSVQEVVELLENEGAEIVGISSLVDRSDGKAGFAYPFKSLLEFDIKSYPEEKCPLCQKDIPFTRPGSKEEGV